MFCLENVWKCWVEGKLIKQSGSVALWEVVWSGAFLKAGGWEGKVEKLAGSFNSQAFPAPHTPFQGVPFCTSSMWIHRWLFERGWLDLMWFWKKRGCLLWLKYLSHCYSVWVSIDHLCVCVCFVFLIDFFFLSWQVITPNSYWWPFKPIKFFPAGGAGA